MRRVIVLPAAALLGALVLSVGGAAAGRLDTLTITPPADITVAATGPCGSTYCATVSYSYSISGGTPPYTLSCNLPSGTPFTVGSHTVSCIGQDAEDDSTPPATFTVIVRPPGSGPAGGSGTGGASGESGGGSGGSGGSGSPPPQHPSPPPAIASHPPRRARSPSPCSARTASSSRSGVRSPRLARSGCGSGSGSVRPSREPIATCGPVPPPRREDSSGCCSPSSTGSRRGTGAPGRRGSPQPIASCGFSASRTTADAS